MDMAGGMWVDMGMDMWTNATDFDAEMWTDEWFERCGDMAYSLWHISYGIYQFEKYGLKSVERSYGTVSYGILRSSYGILVMAY